MDTLTERLELLTRCPLWAITPESYAALLARVISRLPWESKFEALKQQTKGGPDHKVMVIPIEGVLTKDSTWAGTTYSMIANAAEEAASNPTIKHVVLAVDSPGGEVTGLPETAVALAQLAKVKSVSAIVDGYSASAAYWLTSQATDITLAPSAEVGSVGVRMMHVDVSKALDDAGLKVTEVFAGKYKTELSPFHALSDEAKEHLQTRLDTVHTDFLTAVGNGRGDRAKAEIRTNLFGHGRMFSAKDALGNGMADAITSSREFYKAILPPQVETEGSPSFGFPTHAEAFMGMERARRKD